MPLHFVSGDPLLTQADVLAIGHNAKGRTELDDLSVAMRQKYTEAFSAYLRQARKGRQKAGEIFIWSQSTPRLFFLTVRDSSVGATRLRYIQKTLITIARDFALYNIPNIAIAPMGNQYERDEIQALYEMWLKNITIPVFIYLDYQPDVQADEPL